MPSSKKVRPIVCICGSRKKAASPGAFAESCGRAVARETCAVFPQILVHSNHAKPALSSLVGEVSMDSKPKAQWKAGAS
jgi:hypothetical protein